MSEQVKYLKHTLWPLQHIQHPDEIAETFRRYTCNIHIYPLQHMQYLYETLATSDIRMKHKKHTPQTHTLTRSSMPTVAITRAENGACRCGPRAPLMNSQRRSFSLFSHRACNTRVFASY
jgi:hypothetical protein